MLSPEHARIRSFEVVPALPDALAPLIDIANNIWWSWQPQAVDLFKRLDSELWESTGHNPVKLLGTVQQTKLDAAVNDPEFLHAINTVKQDLERDNARTPWHIQSGHELPEGSTVAYFCAEFGMAECFNIYSGGLGCLAGDHLKSASELGIPLIALGLLYRHGYFQQYLSADGWQQETTPDLDFANLPVEQVKTADGQQVTVHVDLPGRSVAVGLWKSTVGRIPLYLLDTNLEANRPDDRAITGQLYGGDMETRIKQEIVLGIGGVRALEAIGIRPDVCHMNEGHSAFLALERIRRLIEDHDLTFDEARAQAAASHVFTTHTPVPAGIDRFPSDMVKTYLQSFAPSLRLDMEGVLALGRDDVSNKNEPFSMATLAIRTSDACNGVSKLHGVVSRDMWQAVWPHVPHEEVPITHVTNGVHARTWLCDELLGLLNTQLGDHWRDHPADHGIWDAIHRVSDEDLWKMHQNQRRSLMAWVRTTLTRQLADRGVSLPKIKECVDGLSDDALTIGFARRFATYKRGNLILRDAERLKRILMHADRPVQILIAGKAHPADGGGKDLIRQLVHFGLESEAGHKVVFIENYDMHVARHLVQGCDIWLNTPKRGMEASGTSGMKAAINGVLNCSILDGWWDEAFESEVGWAIGRRENYPSQDIADDIESNSLYELLEHQIGPLFYERDEQGLPREWIARMKQCIAKLAPFFNTNRMVQQYAEELYFPALVRAHTLKQDDLSPARDLAHQTTRLRHAWSKLAVTDVSAETDSPLGVSEPRPLSVEVDLAGLSPEEVRVQVYIGELDNDGRVAQGHATNLGHHESLGDGKHRYTGQLTAQGSGRHGFAIRILPGGELFEPLTIPGLIHWETYAPKPKAEPAKAVAAAK
ncbi:alpha-glucan family phosphorylase [Algisphaera agarilytica]|uniref:Starch phosphorylase n=1 Tax=Algisphaera agarilytica TaxID=1385975 RepID=A0A7X0LK00_9BACT|nr:alpha-glucan family phosphorylase [Algisphaera agarilytica]MBB6428448.1 starch phosphorylase [Algisphaera agarilytica]